MPERISHIGQRVERITVIADAPTRGGRSWSVIRCDCGTIKEVRSSHIGTTIFSCGCLYREMMASRITHHMSGTPTYESWCDMIKRCTKPNRKDFKYYGGNGVTFCERWLKFKNFLEDMGVRPDGKTIDRWPNKSGNYEPGNCRWATQLEQVRNTSQNRNFTVLGRTGCLSELAAHFGVKYLTVHTRLKHNWDVTRAFTQPARPMKRKTEAATG